MHSRLVASLLVLLAFWPRLAAPAEGYLSFDVPVMSGAERYSELLEYPSYLAVALENAGVKPSNAARVVFVDARSLAFRNLSVSYESRRGPVYIYRARIEWHLGVSQVTFDLPVEVDTGAAPAGRVTVRVLQRGNTLLPASLVDRMSLKLNSLAAPQLQSQVMRYLDTAAANRRAADISGLLERILIDAYNLPAAGTSSGGREPGDAEPVKDQALLIASLLIWMVAVPGALGFALYFRQRKTSRRNCV